MTLYDFIQKGGIINVILAVAYLISVVIIVERFYFFFKVRSRKKVFAGFLHQNEDDPKITEMILSPDSVRGGIRFSPYFQLGSLYARHRDDDDLTLRDKVLMYCHGLVQELESGVWVLHLLGTLAPMLGLTGTMSGLIKVFFSIERSNGRIDVSALAGGIWEAMLTTFAGLIVGILALASYRVLDHMIEKRATHLEAIVRAYNLRFGRQISVEP